MKASEYLRARAILDCEYRANIKKLDDVWEMLHKGEAPPKPIENHDVAVTAVRGLWRKIARDIIAVMPSGTEFTVTDIRARIEEKNPLLETEVPQISMLLKSLAGSKEIKILEQGKGRRATVYAKK